eukprot:scaffold2088_cov399-Prasinococcus_capsulatus_cf.AAC.49
MQTCRDRTLMTPSVPPVITCLEPLLILRHLSCSPQPSPAPGSLETTAPLVCVMKTLPPSPTEPITASDVQQQATSILRQGHGASETRRVAQRCYPYWCGSIADMSLFAHLPK